MCGRYTYIPTAPAAKAYLKATGNELSPNYNVAPGQMMPVETAQGVEVMKWGLVPSWAKQFKASFTSINARAETVAEKPLYKTPFEQHRCLVPASGFYEWQQLPTFKQPFYFMLPDRENFNFAGLFDVWYDAERIAHKSYTILTTTANKTLSEVHDRMPVILDPEEEQHWLDAGTAPEELQLLMDPYNDAKMASHAVDRSVGNIKNNMATLLLPLNSK